MERRQERFIEETVAKPERGCEIAKTTLKSLRAKYSGLTPQFSGLSHRSPEDGSLPVGNELEGREAGPVFPERKYRMKYRERQRSPYSFREDGYQENFDANISRDLPDESCNRGRKGRPVRESEKAGTRVINSAKELSDFFNFVINSERKLENLKKELSLRPDFNLIDLFMFFDQEKKGFCDGPNLSLVMRELRVDCKDKDLSRLFSRFDRNRKGFLRFAEFCDCFCPVSRESFEILNQRKPINNEEKFRMKEVFEWGKSENGGFC